MNTDGLDGLGSNRGRDRTPELERERIRNERRGELRLRAEQIKRIMDNPRHYRKTKEKQVAQLEALWAERDQTVSLRMVRYFDLQCEVCHKKFRTPRDPKQHHGTPRCPPCAR